MAKVCADPLCRLTANTGPPRQFFRIPQTFQDAKAWLEFIHSIGGKLPNPFDEQARQNVLLCDRHFNHCCFTSSIASPQRQILPGHYPTKRIDSSIVYTQATSMCGFTPPIDPLSSFDDSDIFDFCFPKQSTSVPKCPQAMPSPYANPVNVSKPKPRGLSWAEDFEQMNQKYTELQTAYKRLKEEHETLASKWKVSHRRMVTAEKLNATLVFRNNMITKKYLNCKQQLHNQNMGVVRVINIESDDQEITILNNDI